MDNKDMQILCEKLNNLFDATTKSSMIHECTIHVESTEGDFIWSKEYGGRALDSIMNIASITKLFTTNCIINLIEQGKLSLNDKLGEYFGQEEAGSLHDAFKKYAFHPLGLQNTYLMENENDYCADMYYKNKALHLPKLWSSIPACGGCMSTSKEIMVFLKAFFGGALFDKKIFEQLKRPAMIQYAPPLGQYCGGFVRLNISGIASFYQVKGELIGHMGGSGAFAYYYPEKNLYLVGDVNQFAKPGLIFTLPLKIAKLAYKYL